MKFSWATAAAVLASGVVAAPTASVVEPRADLAAAKSEVAKIIGDIQDKKMAQLRGDAANAKRQGGRTCTADNIAIRKEYGDLTREERTEYIRAVKCLMAKPGKTDRTKVPGARSRYDDFVVTHLEQTLKIHFTGNFMAWHRWFIYSYEQALRNECGYKGYQPYWDWARYADAPQDSPIFNGDEYSLGGNGEYVPGRKGAIVAQVAGGGVLRLPLGLGGGPVRTGPFGSNRTILLGPVQPEEGAVQGPDGGLGENLRPWKRDVGPAVNLRFANYTTLLDLLRKPDVDQYRWLSEGPKGSFEIGPHAAGHYIITSDPADDVFSSPNDPAFFVHHGMMDRMWTLWQLLDPSTRYSDLGTGLYSHQTWWNEPASDLTGLDEVLDMGVVGGKITIREAMDTTNGPFCYFYQ